MQNDVISNWMATAISMLKESNVLSICFTGIPKLCFFYLKQHTICGLAFLSSTELDSTS